MFLAKGIRAFGPTNIVAERKPAVWLEGPSKDRWKKRSTTYLGVAKAMAEAWG